MYSCVRFLIIVMLLSTAITGCMVGPDFHSPGAPRTKAYTKTPLPEKTVSINTPGGHAQRYVMGETIPAAWWTVFHSKELDCLLRAGIAHSPNVAAAQAALAQAKELYYAQIGSTLFPAFSGQLGGSRQRTVSSAFGGDIPSLTYDLYNATVNVTYTLDVFGGARRAIENLRAQVDYQAFQYEAAYLTLASNIVTTAITAASLQAQIKATRQLIKSQENELNIFKKQYKLGGISGVDVQTQLSQVAQIRATLPPLEQSLAQAHHALAVLVGEFPNQRQFPDINLNTLHLPANLPVSLPSRLARQRPDIRASEALLHAACAQVGVATANLYPQISLTGAYGWESGIPANLFNSSNNLWNFGGSLVQPIFNAGSLMQKKRAAIDAFDQASAQYRQVVLNAFQNVADTLRALQHDAEAFRAQTQFEVASKNAYEITRKQYYMGGVTYVSLLIAERQYQQAVITRIQAQAARYNDTAALFQALGGGWWNRKCEVCSHG